LIDQFKGLLNLTSWDPQWVNIVWWWWFL